MTLLALGLSGCVGFVARQIEQPGRSDQKQLAPLRRILKQAGFRYEAMHTRQGVRIAYWFGQARDYRMKLVYSARRDGDHTSFSEHFHLRALDRAVPLPVRGSIVLLHPWGMEGSAMAAWGLSFAGAGYRVVMPDLRDQGRSDDAPVGYGPREDEDIIELIHRLEMSHRLSGPLYLMGVSYGAAVALFAAPHLPEVKGVIALEPYTNAAKVIHRAPASGLFGHRWLARWISPGEIDKAILRADRRLGVDLAHIDTGTAVTNARTCTLILGGGKDVLIPPAAMHDLAGLSPRARFVRVDGEGHMTLPLRIDRLFRPMLAWIDALPTGLHDTCPDYVPGAARLLTPGQ